MGISIVNKGFQIFLQTSFLLATALLFSEKVSAQIVINEFSSATTDDWVEIYNITDSEIELSGFEMRDKTESNTVDMSGIISPKGFAEFDFSNKLNNPGDTIRIVRKDSQSVIDTVSYGDDGSNPAPIEGQSLGRKPDGHGSFVLLDGDSRGSSNNDQTIVTPPTPTPTNTPTPSRTPTPSKKPTPTRTPTPSKTPTPTKSPIPTEAEEKESEDKEFSLSHLFGGEKTGSKKSSSGSAVPTAVLGEKTEEREPVNGEVLVEGTSDKSNKIAAYGGFGVVALALCAILVYRKKRYGRYFLGT